MTIHLVTFADSQMSRSALLCAESSKRYGVETHARFNPANISHFREVKLHPEVFEQPDDPRRAWSWWAFKPLIIKRELEWLPEGSTLIYSDAGVEFVNSVNYIIDRMDHDIFLFGNNWEHAHWCKRDVVDEIWGYHGIPEPRNGWLSTNGQSRQVQASVIFFRVFDHTRKFVKEWLDWCLFEGGRLIDDSPSRTPNHPEFREHRHDQAILTTLAYREGIKLHYWPASYNGGAFTYEKLPEYAGDDYPILFNHHRKRNHEWAKCA